MGCLALVASSSFAAGCKPWAQIAADECGNAVIEDGEDCDTFSPGSSRCRPPGSVGECHFDCKPDSAGNRASCPSGWGCDQDSICRQPTGDFQRPIISDVRSVGEVFAADWDADGRTDLVTSEPSNNLSETRFTFHYFDERGSVEQSVSFPLGLINPSVGDLSGDGRADVLFSNGRVGALLGRADRTWIPQAFTSYRVEGSRVRVQSVLDASIENVSAFVALTKIDGRLGLFTQDPQSAVLRALRFIEDPIETLTGFVSGDLLEDPEDAPCRELCLAWSGATRFLLVNACRRESDTHEIEWRERAESTWIELDPPAQISSRPLLADVDSDGHLDVLIGTGRGPYVAYGDGNELTSAVAVGSDQRGPHEVWNSLDEMPLAVGDFTADGISDFVFSKALVSTSRAPDGSTAYEPLLVNKSEAWTVGQIVDLNADGRLDVVAASHDALNITFLRNRGDADFTELSLPTNGPVLELEQGDFDADGVADIAYVEAAPGVTQASANTGHDLAIVFGGTSPTPSAVRAADIANVESLSVVTEHRISGIVVSSSTAQDDGPNGLVTLLEGDGERVPLAQYQLNRFSSDNSIAPAFALAQVSGSFRGSEHRDVIALAAQSGQLMSQAWGFWLLPDFLQLNSAPVLLEPLLPPGLLPSHQTGLEVGINVGSASGDFDGDGRDEAVFAVRELQGACGLVWVSLDERATASVSPPLELPEACSRPRLQTIDLDGDGARDLVLLTGEPGSSERKLLALWNDDGFSAERTSALSEPGEAPIAFDVETARIRPETRLAYVTQDQALLLTLRHGQRETLRRTIRRSLENATGVAFADVDGDGATDLALADSGHLSVMRAELDTR